MQRSRLRRSASSAVATALLCLACRLAAQEHSGTQDPAADRGQATFKQSCGFCHGEDATGARGPDLVRSPLLAHDVKGNLIGEVVRQGRPDKGMPAMNLSDAQIAEIAAFLHARAAEAMESATVPRVYAVEKLLTGNAQAGKTFFNGAGGCNKCHSPEGDLAKVAAKYPPIQLQAKMLYPGGKHTTATVTLPNGQQVKGPLEHADDFVVALRDADGWYRSFARDQVKVELHDDLSAHRELLGKLTQAQMHDLFAYLQTLK